MRKVTEILPVHDHRPIELRHLRVVAYCRVSTELEEQTSSIELQVRYYSQLISANPNWESAGIFAERVTGLNTKERPEFRRVIAQCRKKRIDLILTKSINRFGCNTLDMLRSLRDLHGLGDFEDHITRVCCGRCVRLNPSIKCVSCYASVSADFRH